MSQVSYGTITITDTNDIERIYTVYAKSTKNTVVPSIAKESWSENVLNAPGTGNYIWQRTVVQKSGTQEKSYSDPVCLTGEEGESAKNIIAIEVQYGISANWNTQPSSWSENTPNYDSSKPNYWTRTRLKYEGNTYSSWVVNKDYALTEAIYNSVVANSIAQHANEDSQGAMSQAASNLNSIVRLWYAKANSTAPAAPTSGITTGSASTYNAWSTVKPTNNSSYQYYFYCDQSCTGGGVYSWSNVVLDTSTLSQYQIGALTTKVKNFWWDSTGAHVASGKNGNEVTTSTISTYGYHALMGLTGISFNYDSAKVVDLNSTTPSLDFYQPPTISGSTVTQGKKTMMLSANALRFYSPSDGTTEQAVLDANGLILKKGGIKAGTVGSNNGIYISSENLGSKVTSLDADKINWRAVIGSKFGVDSEGNLYANEAHISGEITASKLTISSNATINDTSGLIRNDAINIGGRNLVWDTEWKNISMRWTDWGTPTTREIVTLDGKRWLHLVTTANSYQGYSQNWTKRENLTSEIQAGDTIVFSYTAYAETAGQVCTVGCHWNDSSGSIVNQNWFASSLTTTPKRYTSQPFTVPANAVKFNVMIGQGVAQVQDLYITEVKIEKGNKATDWTPAPEDAKNYTDTAISGVVSQIDETQATANATAAKTSSMSYENGELILSDSTSAFAVKITKTRLSFIQGNQEVAFIDNNQLFIPYTVVLNAMDVGPWRWMKQEDNNLTLQWIGG